MSVEAYRRGLHAEMSVQSWSVSGKLELWVDMASGSWFKASRISAPADAAPRLEPPAPQN